MVVASFFPGCLRLADKTATATVGVTQNQQKPSKQFPKDNGGVQPGESLPLFWDFGKIIPLVELCQV